MNERRKFLARLSLAGLLPVAHAAQAMTSGQEQTHTHGGVQLYGPASGARFLSSRWQLRSRLHSPLLIPPAILCLASGCISKGGKPMDLRW